MKLWLDQMLPRRFCALIQEWAGCDVSHVGTTYANDAAIFAAARDARVVVLTKDSDFVSLIDRLGAPPQVIWLRCGNCSNPELERILKATLTDAIELLDRGEPIVEVTGVLDPPGG